MGSYFLYRALSSVVICHVVIPATKLLFKKTTFENVMQLANTVPSSATLVQDLLRFNV